MGTPRILVMAAAGKTGMPVTLQLLREGFKLTAFVHTEDRRSERLKTSGASISSGTTTDINDIRRRDGMGFVRVEFWNILSLVFRVKITLNWGSCLFSLDPPYCIFRSVLVNFLPSPFFEILSERGVVHYGLSPLLRRDTRNVAKKPSMAINILLQWLFSPI